MLLYHYTDVYNLKNISENGLKIENKNNSTKLINAELMNSTHLNKIDRDNCIFLLPYKPEVKEDFYIIEVNTDILIEEKLFIANFHYADCIWKYKRYLPDHMNEIQEYILNYWNSVLKFKDYNGLYSLDEDQEILYFNNISKEHIKIL
jgi:hypothetical protein